MTAACFSKFFAGRGRGRGADVVPPSRRRRQRRCLRPVPSRGGRRVVRRPEEGHGRGDAVVVASKEDTTQVVFRRQKKFRGWPDRRPNADTHATAQWNSANGITNSGKSPSSWCRRFVLPTRTRLPAACQYRGPPHFATAPQSEASSPASPSLPLPPPPPRARTHPAAHRSTTVVV